MRRFALLLGVGLWFITTSAVAQNCDGFTDVLASSPFCPDVTWLATYGVTKGCGGSQFCPNENVTRLQMAAFMHRLGENPAFVNGGNAFGTTAVLGPTDNQTLILQSNGSTVLSLATVSDSNFTLAANVVGGLGINNATGAVGATIAGGGCTGGSVCSGPQPNVVKADFGTIGGGFRNTAWELATVAGGYGNTASGIGSTVSGGQENTAGGDNSTVAGGLLNTAKGSSSFAAGYNANAASDGCFVWSDLSSPSDPTDCGTANAFVARAMGGVYLITGGTYPAYTGAVLNAGSTSWTTFSDRNGKDHIVAVDAQEVLAKVAALPIATWNWKSQDAAIRHMGPMAQDFAAAFGLGETPRGINTVDSEGVALAAIKGLNAKVEEQALTIAGQQREIAELTERVQRAETLAADVVALKAALVELQRERETVAVR